jgi:hypothetical protein
MYAIVKFFFSFFIVCYLISCSKPFENLSPEFPDGLVDVGNQKFDKRLYAIGQFNGAMTCTATYIEVPNQTLDSPAYIITNGHCTNATFEDNSIYLDEAIDASVTFKLISGIAEQQIRFTHARVTDQDYFKQMVIVLVLRVLLVKAGCRSSSSSLVIAFFH